MGPLTELNMVLFLGNNRFNVTLFSADYAVEVVEITD